MFNMKEKINSKKTILATLSFVFAIFMVCVFVYCNNTKQNYQQPNLNIEETVNAVEGQDSGLKMMWGKDNQESKKIIPLAQTTKTVTKSTYKITYSTSLATLNGGTIIRLTNSTDSNIELTLYSGSTALGTIDFEPLTGYSLGAVVIAYGSNETVSYDSSNATHLANLRSGVTTEQADPNYSGIIVFKAKTNAITYQVDFFYKGTHGYDKYTVDYSIINPIIVSKNNTLKSSTWIFNTKSTSKITSNPLKIGNISFTMKSGSEIKNAEGYYCYELAEVSGSGNFIDGSGQDANDPTITRLETNQYTFTIKNDVSYWSDKDVDKASLYGVETTAGASDHTTSVSFGVYQNSGIGFMNNVGKAFWKQTDFQASYVSSYKYFLYNYGYHILGYYISINETQFFALNGTTIGLTTTKTMIPIEDLNNAGVNFGDIAEIIDTKLAIGITDSSKFPTITIQPVWEAVQMVVPNYNDGMTYASEYEIIAGLSGDGQTFYCFTPHGENELNTLISEKAIWNYSTIDKSCYTLKNLTTTSTTTLYPQLGDRYGVYMYFGYGIWRPYPRGESETGYEWPVTEPSPPSNLSREVVLSVTTDYYYEISLDILCLDNVYKINLNNIIDNDGKYKLNSENTDFVFATVTYDEDVYSYLNLTNDEMGEFKYYSAQEYPLVDNYSTFLKEFRVGYTGMINSNDHEIFRKVYYSEGTVSGDTLTATETSIHIYLTNMGSATNLPMFDHDYAKIIAWKTGAYSYLTSGYTSDLNLELSDYSQTSRWGYEIGTDFESVYVYNLRLYYENGTFNDKGTPNNTNDDIFYYDSKTAKWFGSKTQLPINGDYNPNVPENKFAFSGWILNLDNAEDVYGYTVTKSLTNNAGTIKLSKDDESDLNDIELTFTVSGKVNYNNYYYITAVSGSGIFIQDLYEDNDLNKQFLPIVSAKWANKYNLKLDNSQTYWSGKTETDSNGDRLYGAYTSEDSVNNNSNMVTFVIANSSDGAYNYAFQSTNDMAFYKQSDMQSLSIEKLTWKTNDEKYYYVYNYGYYITDWNIRCSNKSFTYSDGEWTANSDLIESTQLLNLTNVSFEEVAALMDDYFAAMPGDHVITIKPVWEKVNIQVCETTTPKDVGTLKFSDQYSLSGVEVGVGKTLFAYSYGEDNYDLIAYVPNNGSSGVWNYKEIEQGKYSYALPTDSINGSGIYTINVTPVALDNIYKINLSNVKIYNTNTYVLGDSDYLFNSNSGAYQTNDAEIKFNSYVNSPFVAYDSTAYPLVDEYVKKLKGYRDSWTLGIANGGFDILRKVYYSFGTRDAEKKMSVTENSAPNFWIYLANGQNTGELPVFEKEYYTHIFWKNTGHTDHTKCDGCSNNSNHYAYVTNEYNREYHGAELAGY